MNPMEALVEGWRAQGKGYQPGVVYSKPEKIAILTQGRVIITGGTDGELQV